MKHIVSIVVLAAMVVAVPVAAASAGEDDAPTAKEMERRERQLDLEAREAEQAHQERVRELELQQRRVEIEAMRRRLRGRDGKEGGGVLLLALILATNIVLTVWVRKDMREQKIGRALWVPIVLLAGVFGAILYAIVRNADTRPRPPQAA